MPTDAKPALGSFARTNQARYAPPRFVEGRVSADRVSSGSFSSAHRGGPARSERRRRNDPAMPGVEIPRPGAGKHSQQLGLAATVVCQRRELGAALVLGRPHHCNWRQSSADAAAAVRRHLLSHCSSHLLVPVHRTKAADRFHLSAAVEPADLPHAGVHQFRQGAGAAPPDPLGVWSVPVSYPGRTACPVAGKARARRRSARHDHHVQRRPRLHHNLGNLQGRSQGSPR